MGITSKKVIETIKKDMAQKRKSNGQFLESTPLIELDKVYLIEDDDYEVCRHFGCGKRLTHFERLYSKYCFIHNKQNVSNMDNNLQQLTEELKNLHLMKQSLLNKWAECNRQNIQFKDLLQKVLDADFKKIGMSNSIKAEIKTLLDSLIIS